MRIPVFLFFVLIAFSRLALAQNDLPTIGSFDDIKGLSKTYVVADNESRKAILKELKKIPTITLVNTPDDAEFFLEYKTISRNEGAQIGIFKITSETGQLDVYLHRDGKKVVAWSESTTGGGFKGDTARRLIEKFVKLIKKK